LRAVRLFVYYLLFSTQIWIELRSVFVFLFYSIFKVRCASLAREALRYNITGAHLCQPFIFDFFVSSIASKRRDIKVLPVRCFANRI